MNLNKQLEWRYATKKMNGTEVPQKKIDSILESIRLTPSSYGLTPYSVLVISDSELRKKIQPAVYMQPQIVEGSHVLVFAGKSDIAEKDVDDYMALIAKTRGVSVESLADFKKMIWGSIGSLPQAAKQAWAAKQAYIAFGVGIAAAALEEVDATPMEGFDSAKLDEALGLTAKGLKSAVILALGYRDEKNDHLVNQKKVRKAKEDLFIEL
ncbi:MAG: NAD(P)H-dependent oxidoreductase [Candidatus Pacebacteria bacterium]|nr:NAD(P)H-dependent oxidoreductase [Candidatus Paceibacterota bacterium]